MILARLALVTGLSCSALIAFPVKADVMEINADGARWVTGGSTALPAAPTDLISAEPISEVPADIFVPDIAVADPGQHARLVPQGYQAKVAELAARLVKGGAQPRLAKPLIPIIFRMICTIKFNNFNSVSSC